MQFSLQEKLRDTSDDGGSVGGRHRKERDSQGLDYGERDRDSRHRDDSGGSRAPPHQRKTVHEKHDREHERRDRDSDSRKREREDPRSNRHRDDYKDKRRRDSREPVEYEWPPLGSPTGVTEERQPEGDIGQRSELPVGIEPKPKVSYLRSTDPSRH